MDGKDWRGRKMRCFTVHHPIVKMRLFILLKREDEGLSSLKLTLIYCLLIIYPDFDSVMNTSIC
uniref:Uncharacterized protein n=1 Tax=Romanomermis culicivorax TaxID=13658 RepID=A0A915KP23_ROMCU